MGSNYLFSLQPTFTQGLILGQLSILCVLTLILRHLFFDSPGGRHLDTPTYHPRLDGDGSLHPKVASYKTDKDLSESESESAEWFNVLVEQVMEAYRSKLREDLPGLEGDEVVRKRVEEIANKLRPVGYLDPIKVHSVDLGVSSPRLFNARFAPRTDSNGQTVLQSEFDVSYTDTASVSFSTAVLLNFPKPAFARLPVTLSVSLSIFSSSITVIPPPPHSPAPSLTISLSPQFTLDLKTTSLMGSRAKLADVPKLHELIQMQVRRALADRATWKIVLPGLASVAEVKEEVKREQEELATGL